MSKHRRNSIVLDEWTHVRPLAWSACFTTLFLATTAAFGQLICMGDACKCENEQAPPPNLSVAQAVHVTGKLTDELGIPFVFEIVQVRTIKEKAIIVTAAIDSHGRFDLGIVPAGQYRLIAARRLQDGKLERQALAGQPSPMSCSGEHACSITAIQHIYETELPFESCPPQ